MYVKKNINKICIFSEKLLFHIFVIITFMISIINFRLSEIKQIIFIKYKIKYVKIKTSFIYE